MTDLELLWTEHNALKRRHEKLAERMAVFETYFRDETRGLSRLADRVDELMKRVTASQKSVDCMMVAVGIK